MPHFTLRETDSARRNRREARPWACKRRNPGVAAEYDAAGQWTGYQAYVLTILWLVYMSNYADRHLLSVLIEPMKEDLGTTDTQMGLLTGIAFAIFYVLFGLPIARWADRGDRRTLLAVGIAVWSLMTAATGAARSFFQC